LLIIIAILGVALILFALYVMFDPPRWALKVPARKFPQAVYFVETHEQAIALTIDDAPHPAVTPGILDVLERYNAKATFFVLGSNAEKYPHLIEAIREKGHELGNHMYLDRRSASLSSDEFVENLLLTDSLIQIGDGTKWCRPGFGHLTDRIVDLMVENGYRPCMASAYPLDVRFPAGVVKRQFLTNLRPGAILVLHDGGKNRVRTIRELDEILPVVLERGYRVVTVSELVALGQ
jgi:peptidoglycan/xylan/chitin deacetylase (PgdA/CDA1 family)